MYEKFYNEEALTSSFNRVQKATHPLCPIDDESENEIPQLPDIEPAEPPGDIDIQIPIPCSTSLPILSRILQELYNSGRRLVPQRTVLVNKAFRGLQRIHAFILADDYSVSQMEN